MIERIDDVRKRVWDAVLADAAAAGRSQAGGADSAAVGAALLHLGL